MSDKNQTEKGQRPEKLDMHSPDLVAQNIAKLAALFPNCVTEALGDDGEVTRQVDFDALRQELASQVVEGPRERYHLDWPGKRAAMLAANAPISKTLRPCREESVDFDTTQNLFIEGDNLEALKLLQETYLNRVKLIYIDPPYNTGRDFIYDDDYAESSDEYLTRAGERKESGEQLVANTDANGRFHSDWLSMMYPRLRLARNLLADDGVIFISIDDNEMDNLRSVCDEIFGTNNFVATIIWQKVYAPKNSAQWFSEDHDYILVYARSKSTWRPNDLPRTPEMEARYKNPDNDSRGPWKAENFSARNRYDAGVFPVTCPSGRVIEGPPRGRYWVVDEARFKELDADNRIWWGSSGDNVPAIKKFLSEVSGGRTPQTLWSYKEVGHTQDAKKTLLKFVNFEHTENVLNSVKPVSLVQRILQLATNPKDGDIVVDFFSGSASTAHAVLQQNSEDGGNRRFIGVQVAEPLNKPESKMNSIFDMGRERVRNVLAELSESLQDSARGFRVLKVDSSNVEDVYYRPDEIRQEDLLGQASHIKPDRTAEDLLFQVMLDWGVDLGLPVSNEKLAGFDVLFVDENALAACFDSGINEALVKAIAEREPLRVVFSDAGFVDDATRINVTQLFAMLSQHTEVRCI